MGVVTQVGRRVPAVPAVPATRRAVRPGDPLTPEEWLELPEGDGWLDPDGEDKGEVIDGVYVVSAQPDDAHQWAAARLARALEAAIPPGLFVLAEGGLVVPGRHGFGPDLAVKRVADFRDRRAVPLLVVEVGSPSTRRRDEVDKRRGYAEAGVPSYWLLDLREPALTVLQLGASGAYVEVRTLVGEESAVVDRPFPVRLCPADLVAAPS